MNNNGQLDPQQHIPILGWLYLVSHAIFLVIGVFLFILLTGIGVASGDADARAVLGVVGTALGMLLTALAIPGLLAGYGLLAKKPWARLLTIVVGALGLLNFPFGTAIGVYTLLVLTQPSAPEYFAAPSPV